MLRRAALGMCMAVPRAANVLGPASWVLQSQHVTICGANSVLSAGVDRASRQRHLFTAPLSLQRVGAERGVAATGVHAHPLCQQVLLRVRTCGAGCTVASANKSVEGTRSVGSVHRGKIMGNVVEAWESRAVQEIQEKRDPAHFDDFRVNLCALRAILAAVHVACWKCGT
jgi:hypothetical protein